MSDAKHTPGPWVQGCESIDPEWRIVTTSGGAIIANVNGADEANALLIAAAPDLLNALEQAIALVDDGTINIRPSDRDKFFAALTAWNSAIAKARGQS